MAAKQNLTSDGVAARLKSDRAATQAKALRRNATPSEKELWLSLRRVPDLRFRRQVPFGPFIVDFASHGAKLIIELDGGVHDSDEAKRADAERQSWLEGRGYRVLRISNQAVRTNIGVVMRDILEAAKDRT